ncbi:MAG: LacI family transcriptional regulator [Candidatus Marinimicrobia bacterium]|jgi:LacI family transcriptional regulator|nr:LacI family transcriptional regulator [Candidatus Neomarinimicrobiota bacterium]
MATTIKDIARKAGVSISTVSLVLNHKGYVADETREKILSIIKEMDYKPLHSARKLATQKTGNMGYILWEGHFSEVEMFYSQVFLGMEYAARKNDYYILLTTVNDHFDPRQDLPRFLKYNDVDGVALAGRVPLDLIHYLDKHAIPFVLVDYEVPGKNYNTIKIDNYNGAFRAVEFLIEQGRRHISFVGGTFIHPSIKERYRGYKDALEKHGLLNNSYLEAYSYCENVETSRAIGEKGIKKLLKSRPEIDGVFCCNDTTALGVLSGIQSMGKTIPEDVAVIGFDDIPPAEFSSPKLSTVSVPKLDIGKEAYKLLYEQIYNPNIMPQTRIISVDLVIRESSQTKNKP